MGSESQGEKSYCEEDKALMCQIMFIVHCS